MGPGSPMPRPLAFWRERNSSRGVRSERSARWPSHVKKMGNECVRARERRVEICGITARVEVRE